MNQEVAIMNLSGVLTFRLKMLSKRRRARRRKSEGDAVNRPKTVYR